MLDPVMLIEPQMAAQMRVVAEAVLNGASAESFAKGRGPRALASRATSEPTGHGSVPLTPAQMLERHGYYKVGSLAVLPICGPIDRVESFWTMLFGGTSVDRIAAAANAVAQDSSVERVVLHIDSPGGTAHQDLAVNALRALAEAKPLHAFGDAYVCSSAYWLASIADELAVTRQCMVGSIGSVLRGVLFDVSEHLERDGIKAHGFSSAKHKLAGYWGLPIDEDQAANLQQLADRFGAIICGDVAVNRGVSEKSIKALEGALFVGGDAMKPGLADRVVGTLDELITELSGMTVGERATRTAIGVTPESDEEPEPAEPENQESVMAKDGTGTAPGKADDKTGAEGQRGTGTEGNANPQNSAAGTPAPATFEQLEAIAAKLPEAKRDGFITQCQRGKMTEAQATLALVDHALKLANDATAGTQSEIEKLRAENANLKKLGDEGKGVAPVNGKPGAGAGGGGSANTQDKLGISACKTYDEAVASVSAARGISIAEARSLVREDSVGRKLRASAYVSDRAAS